MFLSQTMQETFDVVKRRNGTTAKQLRNTLDKEHNMNPTAFNNRLAFLKELGLATCERKGREWVYTATK